MRYNSHTSEYRKIYRNNNKQQIIDSDKKYYEKNKEQILKNNKKRNKEYYKKFPWKRTFKGIKDRCNNSNDMHYSNYGGRGIKCLITSDELKQLWFRDKAYLMDRPSIDRIDNDGNYECSNCRYIELSTNCVKDRKKTVLQYDKNNRLIKKWNSLKEASLKLNISHGNISECASHKRKSAGGFCWVLS